MQIIKYLTLEKHNDSAKYELVEDGIYKDLSDSEDTNHRIALSFSLEEGEDSQYPIEDVLDKYYLYVSEFLSSDSGNILNVELAGKLNDIREASSIIGKRVNQT
jgi:hypothetical protein